MLSYVILADFDSDGCYLRDLQVNALFQNKGIYWHLKDSFKFFKFYKKNPYISVYIWKLNCDTVIIYCRDSSQSIDGSPVYTFDMAALSEHLRTQGETNKSASYFNIDILKYQVGIFTQISGRDIYSNIR